MVDRTADINRSEQAGRREQPEAVVLPGFACSALGFRSRHHIDASAVLEEDLKQAGMPPKLARETRRRTRPASSAGSTGDCIGQTIVAPRGRPPFEPAFQEPSGLAAGV